ncbi:MAG: chemotaxis protein CheV [Betaproteobacteria bacterium]|nr:chemotaxis protein CheV [Betaproteobacteria bacterium]
MANGDGLGFVPAGNNLFEMIEFSLTKQPPCNPLLDCRTEDEPLVETAYFGVNVAKVREVIRLPALSPVLGKRPDFLGVFQLRGKAIPAIHLASAIGFSSEPVSASSQVLVTEISGRLTGFVVAGANRIRRVSWDDVLPPQTDVFSGITGMLLDAQNRFVFIIDFEKILADIDSTRGHESALASESFKLNNAAQRQPLGARPVVMIVDDSATARRALREMLVSYACEIVECTNGEQAWLEGVELSRKSRPFLVISDIEMPRLDGYSLVKKMRADSRFANTPLLLHSSLSGEANRQRALSVGADAFIVKFNRDELRVALTTCFEVFSKMNVVESKAS